ncbi:MAG: thermonuclease family protein [Candidatus Paceibacterota bacterium]
MLLLQVAWTICLSGGGREADVKEFQKCGFVCVVDGDTIKVKNDDGSVLSIRMIGIDAPESRPNKRLELQMRQQKKDRETILELGEKSKAHLKELVGKNEFIYLEFDVQKYDKYGRVLAYVYILDKKQLLVMLNEQMLKDGFACLLTIPPNVKYLNRFLTN